MVHSTSKCQMGVATEGNPVVSDFTGSATTYPAGTAVRLKSDNTISVTKADGFLCGVSAGRSLSDHNKLSVIRSGRGVPMLVERQPARGIITITNVANLVSGTDDSITVGATEFTAQAGAATPGDATFQATSTTTVTAASLVAQINAHATAGALVVASNVANVVTVTAKSNSTSGDTIALAYTDNDANIGATVSGATLTDSDDTADWLVLGAKAYISDTSGKVDDPNSGATLSDATIVSALLDGIDEDGATVAAVLVDIPGGL